MNTESLRIVFVGGGSAGHLAPLLAIEEELKMLHPKLEPLFLCAREEGDGTFLTHEDVPYQALNLPRTRALMPFWCIGAYIRSLLTLHSFKPRAVVSKGGVVSVPVVLAAATMRIPVLIHESDSVSGRATRFLALFAKIRCRGLPWERENEPTVWRNAFLTGLPVRPMIKNATPEKGYALTGFDGRKPVLLVMGGSQGAQSINEALGRHREELLRSFDIIHLTGPRKNTLDRKPGYFPLSFAQEELPHLYAISTLAVSRAGAGAFSELALFGIPTILIPLEGLAQNHQLKNAENMEKLKACILMRQVNMERELVPTLERLLKKPEEREQLTVHMQQLASPDAAKKIAEMVIGLTAR